MDQKMSKLHFITTPKEVISSYIVKNNLQKVEELSYPQQYEIAKF